MTAFINSFSENRRRIKAYLRTKDESVLADEQKPFITYINNATYHWERVWADNHKTSDLLDKLADEIQGMIEKERKKQC